MIEVNLLPGGKKRASRRRPGAGFSMPSIGGLPTDRWILGSGAVVLLLLVAAALLYVTRTARHAELEAAVEEAAADSARYADLIAQAEQLRARRDSIAERVEIIQQIDEGRYVWPHILDEVARALPEYTWLNSLVQTSDAQGVSLRFQGFAGNNFALTTFMENLEASPYIRGVTLVNTQLTQQSQGGVTRSVNQFTLDAVFENLPLELRQTVPLFQEGSPPPVEVRPGAGQQAPAGPQSPGGQQLPGGPQASGGQQAPGGQQPPGQQPPGGQQPPAAGSSPPADNG